MSEGDGSDTITDFEDGTDLIGLVGLAFPDLTIEASGTNTNDTNISFGSDLLATLNNVDASLITEADFLV